MNLKDITLGQFFPGNSFLHRVDPRIKLAGLLVYVVALFLANWFVTYGIMLALLVWGCAVAHIRAKTLLGGMKPVIFLLIFTAPSPAPGTIRGGPGPVRWASVQ